MSDPKTSDMKKPGRYYFSTKTNIEQALSLTISNSGDEIQSLVFRNMSNDSIIHILGISVMYESGLLERIKCSYSDEYLLPNAAIICETQYILADYYYFSGDKDFVSKIFPGRVNSFKIVLRYEQNNSQRYDYFSCIKVSINNNDTSD
jgi:hypothetical protein